jgi:predicted Fe-Mo cluster-binding NifX family protein
MRITWKEKPAMKIVITAQDAGLDGPVDPRFGRAKYFVVFDTETGEHTLHDNEQNLNAPQGAGIQAAQTVAALGAQVLLTGHVGPKAFHALHAAEIRVYSGVSGSVRQAIDSWKANQLSPAAKADVDGHWA